MELLAWPVLKPHISDFCLLLLMAGVLDGMKDESGYKSLGSSGWMKSECSRFSR